MQKQLAIIYPIVRTDYIKKSVETLYKYTENFTLIVVDQSIEGLDKEWIDQNVHLYLRMKNQGFAKAANEGIIHALRWEHPYICIANDDTEFMSPDWFNGILEEFATDERIIAVCPESPRVAMWGYGLQNGEMVDILPYKTEYSSEDINYLKKGDYDAIEIKSRHNFEIPNSFPFTKRGVVDGIAMWMPVFKREGLLEKGLLDERFIWGGGEDYCMNCRVYSCAWPIDREECDPKYHKRMVSTMKSWVWHWWGRSKDIASELNPKLFEGLDSWNNLDELYTPKCDPWGHIEVDGVKKPIRRKLPLQTRQL